MQNKKIYLLLGLLPGLLWITGCRDLYLKSTSSVQLQLSVQSSDIATRGIKEGSFPSGSSLGLFLMEENNTYYNGKTYHNIEYTASGEGYSQQWNTESPILLSSTKFKGIAYYPYADSIANYSSIPVKAGQTDYMYSGPVENISSQDPDVYLEMKHALTCIRIQIKRGSYKGKGHLSTLSIQSGTFALEGLLNAETGSVSSLSGINASLTRSGTAEPISENITQKYDFLVIPTEEPDDLMITVCVDGKSYSCKIPASHKTFLPGCVYAYQLIIHSDGISFSDIRTNEPGEIDEDGNPVIDLHGYKVRIGGNTSGIAFSYQVSETSLTLHAVSIHQDYIVNTAELSPVTGGTFTQTENNTSKMITLSDLKQDVWILFNGIQEKRKPVTYTLDTNQGAAEVYVDEKYVGTAILTGAAPTLARLTWTALEYDKDVSVTLKKVTMPPDSYRSRISRISYEQGGKTKYSTFFNGDPGTTISISNLRYTHNSWYIKYSENLFGQLVKGETRLSIYAEETTYGSETTERPLTFEGVTLNHNWNGSHSAHGSSASVTFGNKSQGILQLRFKGLVTETTLKFTVN